MAPIVFLTHSIFDEILSYIRGRPIPAFVQAIRQLLTPIIDHFPSTGSRQAIGLPANSSSYK